MLFTPIVVGAVIVAIVILVAVVMGLRGARQQHTIKQEDVDASESLVYVLPPGQDPTVLVAALEREGFETLGETTGGQPRVVVNCPAGRDRERGRVRSVIQSVHSTGIEGEPLDPERVVFEDEH